MWYKNYHRLAGRGRFPLELAMPKSYLDLIDGADDVFDTEGIQVRSLEDAIAIAVRSAMEIMTADLVEGKLDLRPKISIRDETGRVVHVIRFRDLVDITESKPN